MIFETLHTLQDLLKRRNMSDAKSLQPSNQIVKQESIDEIKVRVKGKMKNYKQATHPNAVWRRADEELVRDPSHDDKSLGVDNPVFQAMTMDEFNLGVLINLGMNDVYKTFSVELSNQF